MQSPSVSIIIPTFNREKLLAITLDNILHQTWNSYEIIVVDDGSTDGTMDLLNGRYAKQVRSFSNSGKGPGAARNTGLSFATGKYIKFFDSDDLMTNNMLQIQLQILEYSQSGFVYSPYFYATQDGRGRWKQTDPAILNYFPYEGSKPLYHWMAIKNLFITIPGMMFKREVIEKVGLWRTDITASEDWDYLWRISKIEPFPLHSNECAFLYRVHGQQTTERNLTHSQRDFDKYHVLMDIYKRDVMAAMGLTNWERTVFRNKFYQMAKVTSSESALYQELKSFDSIYQKLIALLLRFDQKLGRVRTKSNWQPCHGPLVSKKKFDYYLSLINS